MRSLKEYLSCAIEIDVPTTSHPIDYRTLAMTILDRLCTCVGEALFRLSDGYGDVYTLMRYHSRLRQSTHHGEVGSGSCIACSAAITASSSKHMHTRHHLFAL